MTTMTETRLPETLQALIDARLDTIDRMLLGRLPRSDRRAIVGHVEEQIDEMLADHPGDDWTRADVLDLLSRLDPPEAYLPESTESGEAIASTGQPAAARPSSTRRSVQANQARIGGVLGILALILALGGFLLSFGLCFLLDSEYPLLVGFPIDTIGVLVVATIGLVLSIRNRAAGGWAMTGLALNILAIFFSLIFCLYLLMILILS